MRTHTNMRTHTLTHTDTCDGKILITSHLSYPTLFSVTFLVRLFTVDPVFIYYPVMHSLNDWKRQKDMERHKNYSVSPGLYHDLGCVWGVLCLRSCWFLRRKSLCWFIVAWKHGFSLLPLWFMCRQLTTVPDKFTPFDNEQIFVSFFFLLFLTFLDNLDKLYGQYYRFTQVLGARH